MTGPEFEAEVLSIARALWPEASDSGPVIRQGQERDGEFETSEITHLVECTIERSLAKAKKDIEKIRKRILYLRTKQANRLYKGWFITKSEPTPDQRGVAEKCTVPVQAISFREFRKKLVDAERYLSARADYPFGSMRDPITEGHRLEHKYVGLEFVADGGSRHRLDELVEQLRGSKTIVLLGDYGVGKSTTLYEVFRRLKKEFIAQSHSRFPVVLNLRDHHAQTEPVEVLERHARNIGYPNASDLVRAWRAGYVDILLDGFDEIAVMGWAGSGKTLKTIRYRSMELLRRFVGESPPSVGVVLAGRAHYFDGKSELDRSLGLRRGYALYSISELQGDAVSAFLKEIGWPKSVPDWVPTRPLLLGYLVARGILDEVVENETLTPAVGWHTLLDRISEREAQLEPGVEPRSIRRIIEEVAILARNANDGLGQLSPGEVVGAFISVCGYEPDDHGSVLLQRLPGLGAHQTEDGARVFVDRDFANAAAGSALARYIQHPYDTRWDASSWNYALSPLGLEVCRTLAMDLKLGHGNLEAALNASLGDSVKGDTLVADLVSLSGLEGFKIHRDIAVESVWFSQIPAEMFDGDLGRVTIRDSVISELEVPGPEAIKHLPVFRDCQFEMVLGCPRKANLSASQFINCEFERFEESATTTSALLELKLPIGVRVGLTVLKKLYLQKGSGRRANALRRGLGQDAQQILPRVLDILLKHGFAVVSKHGNNEIWLPVKTNDARARALEMLDQPVSSDDPVLVPLKQI